MDLRAALERLPPRELRIVSLRYLDGLLLREIAALEGRSTETIREVLQRALNRLRRFLAGGA
jgi:RNA polymerase sigma factor (sigma-70 family)